ncbi:MAG: DUF6531 domain-containing protein [Corynebacterium sp.]|nr:DUF6531 domain-containing protein [Corynebacterium sp.]
MPVLPLKPFTLYQAEEFRIGGNAAVVYECAGRWRAFGDNAVASAGTLRAVNNGEFLGSEGNQYKNLVNSEFPSHLTTTGQAHNGVSTAVTNYAEALTTATAHMDTLMVVARGNHAAVQVAVVNYNTAEANEKRALVTAQATTAAAASMVLVPGANAIAMSAAVSAQADLSAAEAAFQAAQAEYVRAKTVFDSDVAQGATIKKTLSGEVQSAVIMIRAQSGKRFEENPDLVKQSIDQFNDWINRTADKIKQIADELMNIGNMLMLTPLMKLGVDLLRAGVLLKSILAIFGKVPWSEIAFDMSNSAVGRVLAKIPEYYRKFKDDPSLSAMFEILKEQLGENAAEICSRGGQCVLPDLEPVEMATGEMIDFVTDVNIDGILPMIIDRNSNSSSWVSRALGPGWSSSLDTRIEVLPDRIFMLSPDGALLQFPPAPVDGSEVVANGLPWRLSFVDGAYRIRNIQKGITWIFTVVGDENEHRPDAPVVDFNVTGDQPTNTIHHSDGIEVSRSFVNAVAPGTVADVYGLGVEIFLSATVHHTGAWIEYDYDQATGHMVAMRRSDGTTLELKWHRKLGRLASVWVRNDETHPEDDVQRLMSYEYDGRGRLLRVINSAAGALRYYYDDQDRPRQWTDRNGVSYFYRYDEKGRVIAQVGTGGMFPNAVVWLDDEADDAPEGGTLCVALKCAGEFHGDPLDIGNSCINDYFDRLDSLPIVTSLRVHGLVATGLTGRGRDGARNDQPWTVPAELLHDDYLGDIRPTVYRATPTGDVWRVITAEGEVTDR